MIMGDRKKKIQELQWETRDRMKNSMKIKKSMKNRKSIGSNNIVPELIKYETTIYFRTIRRTSIRAIKVE